MSKRTAAVLAKIFFRWEFCCVFKNDAFPPFHFERIDRVDRPSSAARVRPPYGVSEPCLCRAGERAVRLARAHRKRGGGQRVQADRGLWVLPRLGPALWVLPARTPRAPPTCATVHRADDGRADRPGVLYAAPP